MIMLISGRAEHPDPTTRAISDASREGGICAGGAVMFNLGRAVIYYDCADRALRGISALVYNAPEF
jgi:hypothetical protein